MKRLVKAPGLKMGSGPAVPDQLPVLSRGWHRGPEDGACVMEYVSVLAGARFTDHPRCTPPALAALARLVNDRIVDDGVRSKLALLAPDLIAIAAGPATTHCVIASCLTAAHELQPVVSRGARRKLAKTGARMRRLERGDRWTRIRLRCWELLNPPNVAVSSAFQLLFEQIRGLAQPQRDARLSELLHSTVAACRKLESRPVASAGRAEARTA
ncbi:MAG: hypothetical protein E6G05_14000 [Actinobacteria bacterium]|nr:MAG: hypothetical protein E6G05_14000 [Actinomycetota bacterium]